MLRSEGEYSILEYVTVKNLSMGSHAATGFVTYCMGCSNSVAVINLTFSPLKSIAFSTGYALTGSPPKPAR